jgi:predicted protein tyrosine phosphatase
MLVVNLPKIALENLSPKAIQNLPPSCAIISIGEEHTQEKPKLDHLSHLPILRLEFTDIEKEVILEKETYSPMRESDAKAIITFVENHKNAKLLLVHCHAGISRSASIAKAIHQLYGASLPKDFEALSHPKNYMVEKLRAAFQTR